ncbi:MAG: glutathione S-transferase family protein [Candidatus Competibacteraceae bacterium]|nr:MAG: glutathione S-transferase family protein [Candidatus Competibacteraceae bacterium]
MLMVYGFPNARSSRVIWALEEVGAEYEYVHVDLKAGAGWRPEYLALNAGGKVPTLVDGDFVLTESGAICTYIGDRFPATGLTPPVGGRERARYNQWCYFVLSELEQPLWTIGKHTFALPERRRAPAVLDTARWEFPVAAKVLAEGLGRREFMLGDRFSAADILVAHTLAWAQALKLPLEHDNLESYAARLLARPAWARAREREQEV